MSYVVKWNEKPLKYLERLPKEISLRVLKKLDMVAEDPFRYLEHYEGAGVYKLRIGDYRMLIDVDFMNKLLKIRVFDHRSRVYDRL